MTIILILLGLLLILVLLRLFLVQEGFQNISLNPDVIQGYNNFLSFYNPFCDNWKKAIISSVASEIQQQPLTDPSQVTSSSAPSIPDSDLNTYINQLSEQLGQPLPPICTPLPATIDSSSLSQVIPLIPTSIVPFINALNWMNAQLEKSQANLGSALQGNTVSETFQDVCQNISQCLTNDPQLMQQLAQQMSQQNVQNINQQEQQLMSTIIPFFSTQELSNAFNQNTTLMQKAQQIQDQAQSGDLVKQINIPGGNTINKYNMPSGYNTLSQMKQNDPEQYNTLQKNYGMWFSLKQMIESINANL